MLGYPVAKRCGAVAAGRSLSSPEPAHRGLIEDHYKGKCESGQLTPRGILQGVQLGRSLLDQFKAVNNDFAMAGSFVEPIYIPEAMERPKGGTGGSLSVAERRKIEEDRRQRSGEAQTMHLHAKHPFMRTCHHPEEVHLASTNYGRTVMSVAAVSHGMFPTDCFEHRNISGAPGSPEQNYDEEQASLGLSMASTRISHALFPEDVLHERQFESDWQDDMVDYIAEQSIRREDEREAQGLPPLSDDEERRL